MIKLFAVTILDLYHQFLCRVSVLFSSLLSASSLVPTASRQNRKRGSVCIVVLYVLQVEGGAPLGPILLGSHYYCAPSTPIPYFYCNKTTTLAVASSMSR
jgi:hypothetical protein